MIKRKILDDLTKAMKKKEILALIGSRQVGKTTLMNYFYENLTTDKKNFISFENQKILSLFETNIDDFIEEYVKGQEYLFIDEIQYSKTSGKNLKYIYDEYKLKIVISGSSATDLSINSLSFLVGRVLVYEIFPLNFEEFLSFRDATLINMLKRGINEETLPFVENYFEEFLQFGGYPQITKENTIKEKENSLKNLVNSYLLKEIREILSFENSYEYEKLLEILSIKNGDILNKSNIASDSGIKLNKIDSMISVLEKTYIINLLRPVQVQAIKELIKSPKIYFLDLGFRNAILENFSKSNLRVDKGFIYETFVLSELKKQGLKPKFYNYKNSSEVDFIIEKNGKTIAIEIKSSINNSNIDKSYRTYIEKYKPDSFYILNEKFFEKQEIENTKVIHTHFLNIVDISKLFDI
ncbi:MAG: ATP-binding protein [Nanoarchaeota archaeon]|nr:ATP-binding protein [Nanoarchaeota archaeon]